MVIRKQDNTQLERKKEQRSSDSTKENGNPIAPLLFTPAQILHSGGDVNLQHHRGKAVSSQL
jgi:hypothetical protein